MDAFPQDSEFDLDVRIETKANSVDPNQLPTEPSGCGGTCADTCPNTCQHTCGFTCPNTCAGPTCEGGESCPVCRA